MSGHVFIVDDDVSMCELLTKDLERRGFDVTSQTDSRAALEAIAKASVDVVLTDLRMPSFSGIELCKAIMAVRPDVPVIVVTAFGSMETAVQALRAGAYDFVTKPFELDAIAHLLSRAIDHVKLRARVRRLELDAAAVRGNGKLIGESSPMVLLRKNIARIANSQSTVLVTGESGSGKEVIARCLHDDSTRHTGPFVAVNCAAMPEALLESELFGHVRGAFTDARDSRMGLFQQADGGTLLLDEIGELPLAMQPKLLRVLQEGTVRPIGGNKEIAVNVRLITATNRDLEHEVERQRFREDLFFRINVIALHAPPLRARGTDTLLLGQHLIEMFSARSGKAVTAMTEPFARKLMAYSWPGNVRELSNAIERAVAWTEFEKLTVDDLPTKISGYKPTTIAIDGTDPVELPLLEEMDRRYILHVLKACAGHRSEAAKILGLDRKTLYRKLQRYERISADAPE